ncbi:peptidase M56 [Paenibacillus sp. USDA918EY]|nr:peptidase M56 [Paenibacillus sp. USDA918EY]
MSKGTGTGKSTGPGKDAMDTKAVSKTENASFKIKRLNDDLFKWFHSLDRASNFAGFDFKVPDYLPKGYQLENIDLSKSFSNADRTDLLDVVSIRFVSQFGSKNEQIVEMLAVKGKGSMLEHGSLWGAPRIRQATTTPPFLQEDVAIGHVKGMLFSKTQGSERKPGGARSFVWQDGGVTYAINYYAENDASKERIQRRGGILTHEELAQVVLSFVFPQQTRHVRYDGEGNSFPLYDETDLNAAKNILGVPLKFPTDLPDTQFTLSNSILLRTNDQNTGYAFRQSADALWNIYRPPYNSTIYDLNDELWFYQSKTPLLDTDKLAYLRKLQINGVEISAYADNKHVYFKPYYSEPSKIKSRTLYLWKQDGVCYSAVFLGLDQHQEKNLKALVLAPYRQTNALPG